MDWDLGLVGLLALGSMSIVVGLVAQLLAGASAPNWLWLGISGVYFVAGVVIGEAWFGWVTVHDLSPKDMLLFVLAPIPAVVVVTRALANRGASREPPPAPSHARRSRHPRPRAL